MTCLVRLQLLGTVHIESMKPIPSRFGKKGRALLCYLATHPQQVSRITLINLLWPNMSEARGRNNLNRELAYLRAFIPPDWLQSEGDTVQFASGHDLWLDVDAFASYMHQKDIESYLSAMGLYQGEFMQGFALQGESIKFEDWLILERQRWHGKAVELLNRALQYHHEQSEQVLDFARRLLLHEPWREEIHRSIMLLLARTGQKNNALVQYQRLLEALDELGEEPGIETILLYNRIKQGISKPSHNISPQPTTFIGREKERVELSDKIANPSCRLVTIVGAGGVGKSRLALQISEQMARKAFLHGVCFVPLAATELVAVSEGEYSSVEKTAAAIAYALRLFSTSEQDLVSYLLNYLQDKEMLLVLDNIESLLRGQGKEVREFIAAILHRAPGIKLLITSRERLNLRAEHTFGLLGLSYPSNQQDDEEVDAERYDSIQLFDVTAKRINSRFSLDREEIQAVSKICTLLEGSPLAIELAASLIEERSCVAILAAIRRTLDTLVVEMPDVPMRQRSLRATFEYSWALLNKQEQHLLARLSVFHGSFSYAAAQAITMANKLALDRLVHKSLLKQYEGRYEIHDLVWHYSNEKMALLEEQTPVLDRHSTHYLRLWEQYGKSMNQLSSDQEHTILSDLDNIRAAWQWAIQRKDLNSIERGLIGLETFYTRQGQHQEGIALLRSALEGIKETHPDKSVRAVDIITLKSKLLISLARILHLRGNYPGQIEAAQQVVTLGQAYKLHRLEVEARLEWAGGLIRQGDFEASRNQIERALNLANATSTPRLIADCLHLLGVVAWCEGESENALGYLKDALLLRLETSDQRKVGFTHLVTGGVLLHQGYISEALQKFDLALEIFRELRDRRFESEIYHRKGNLLFVLGDYESAERFLHEALRISRELGALSAEIRPLIELSFLSLYRGNSSKARAFVEQALEITRRLESPTYEGEALLTLGHVLFSQNQQDAATNAYQQSLTIYRELNMLHYTIDPLAGLAAVALQQGDNQKALSYVQEILTHDESDVQMSLTGLSDIYLTCYQVFSANNDSRANECLVTAYRLLQTQAENITDTQQRRSFLENIAPNRAIIDLYRKHIRD